MDSAAVAPSSMDGQRPCSRAQSVSPKGGVLLSAWNQVSCRATDSSTICMDGSAVARAMACA